MKKRLAMLLVLCMTLTLAACGSSGGGASGGASQAASGGSSAAPAASEGGSEAVEITAPAGPFKVGVATNSSGEAWEIQRKYYETELAPTLNMEFMFSEQIQDAAGVIDFIDQAYAAGCVGIISYHTSEEGVSQAARKCEELGLFYVTQNSKVADAVADLPHNIGHCGADPVKMGETYNTLFKDMLADGEPRSLVLYSCGAVGQIAMSHYYTAYGILEAYQDVYGLTYDDSIENILNRQEPGEIVTGRDDIKIYIFPGIDFEGAVVGCQAALQTGNYDILATPAMFQNFTTAVDEIEKQTGKNIAIVGTVDINDFTKTGFETTDSLGNPVLEAGVINPLCPAGGINALEIYNGLVGAGESMKDNGKAVLVGVGPFLCRDAETYEAIAKLDQPGTYIVGAAELEPLMATNNPSVTWQDIDTLLTNLADVDYALESHGITK